MRPEDSHSAASGTPQVQLGCSPLRVELSSLEQTSGDFSMCHSDEREDLAHLQLRCSLSNWTCLCTLSSEPALEVGIVPMKVAEEGPLGQLAVHSWLLDMAPCLYGTLERMCATTLLHTLQHSPQVRDGIFSESPW